MITFWNSGSIDKSREWIIYSKFFIILKKNQIKKESEGLCNSISIVKNETILSYHFINFLDVYKKKREENVNCVQLNNILKNDTKVNG